MNTFAKFIFCIVLVVFYSNNIAGKNTWTIDKKLSVIKFEVPVVLAKKIIGQFKRIGIVNHILLVLKD